MENSRKIDGRFFGLSGCYIFKSQLLEYARIKGIGTPEYETINEGPPYDPRFKSTVIVDNRRYDSLPGFQKRKASGQSAAENALVKLANSEDNKGNIKSLLQESGLCKQLLSQYAQKMKYSQPCYVCRYNFTAGKMYFTCAVTVGETQFTGASAKSKRAAQISAARAALLMYQTRKLDSEARLCDNSQFTVVPTGKNKLDPYKKKITCYKPKNTRFSRIGKQEVGKTGDVGFQGKGLLGKYSGIGLQGKGLLGKYSGKVWVEMKHGEANRKRTEGMVLHTGTSTTSQDKAANNFEQTDNPCTKKVNKLALEIKSPVDLFAALEIFTAIEGDKPEDVCGFEIRDSSVPEARTDDDLFEENIVYEPKYRLQTRKLAVDVKREEYVLPQNSTSMSPDGEVSSHCCIEDLLALPGEKLKLCGLEPTAPQITATSNVGNLNSGPRKIFVAGLVSSLTEDDLRQYFEKYGHVTDLVLVMNDKNTLHRRGSGFVSFDTEDAVDRVLHKTFHDLNGKMVMVRRALPKDANPSTSGGKMGSGGYQATGGNGGSCDGRMVSNKYGQPQSFTGGPRWVVKSSCGTHAARYGGGGSLSAPTRTVS